jgi:hypothetical protein
MTKLEELKAAYDAANAAYDTALKAECACDAATDSAACLAAARDASDATWGASTAARDAYEAELKKVQEENSYD